MADGLTSLHAALAAALASPDQAAALARLAARRDLLTAPEPRVAPSGGPAQPFVAFAIHLIAMGILRVEGEAASERFVGEAADLFAPQRRHHVGGSNTGSLFEACLSLHVWQIEASLSVGRLDVTLQSLLALGGRHTPWDRPKDPFVAQLVAHPGAATFGPFERDRVWLLDRQLRVWRAGLDSELSQTNAFLESIVENALLAGRAADTLPIVESMASPNFASRGDLAGHVEFNAMCVLAVLGRHDDAIRLARKMLRAGYSLRWRVDPHPTAPAWIWDMGQNRWLADIAATPAYWDMVADCVRLRPHDFEAPGASPFTVVEDSTLGGKAKKRCWISRKHITPGAVIVRSRRLFVERSDESLEIADAAAFAASPCALARQQFESDSIPLAELFPEPLTLLRGFKRPEIAAFAFDAGRDPATISATRVIQIAAEHAPPLPPFEWVKGKYIYATGCELRVGADGYGEPATLIWRLLKAGYATDLFAAASALPAAQADKVFALLAMFDRPDCRRAAAAHFELPDLADMIALVFGERLDLKAHRRIADYGAAHPRWRAGLVAAMRAYALHLYSNYRPGVNWYLDGLTHFSRARSCQLIYFLVHHPEDDAVLATSIERKWLIKSVSSGAFDFYGNAAAFYWRAGLLNRLFHAPADVEPWCMQDWVGHYRSGSYDRQTLRLVIR
jgi:hypothetical protein